MNTTHCAPVHSTTSAVQRSEVRQWPSPRVKDLPWTLFELCMFLFSNPACYALTLSPNDDDNVYIFFFSSETHVPCIYGLYAASSCALQASRYRKASWSHFTWANTLLSRLCSLILGSAELVQTTHLFVHLKNIYLYFSKQNRVRASFVQRPASALMATAVHSAKEDSYICGERYYEIPSCVLVVINIMFMTSICRYNVQCSHTIRAISLQCTSSTARWCLALWEQRNAGIALVHRLAITMTTTTVVLRWQ